MKTLTLLRHAKAERDSLDGSDFTRSLNGRGRRDAARMGEEMRGLGLRFDWVLASPARRVVETVEAAGELVPIYEMRIYNASSRQLYDLIRSTDDSVESLLMVGHNPGFEQIAAELTDDAIEDFPTAALVEIELSVKHWRTMKERSGRLVRFIRPKDLD
jgi:phosphohistidine phosphatase